MRYLEGSLRIHRLSPATEPEPWTYKISFSPYANATFSPARDVVGDGQLARALHYGLGIGEPQLAHSVDTARQATLVIHHVALTDGLKALLDDTG